MRWWRWVIHDTWHLQTVRQAIREHMKLSPSYVFTAMTTHTSKSKNQLKTNVKTVFTMNRTCILQITIVAHVLQSQMLCWELEMHVTSRPKVKVRGEDGGRVVREAATVAVTAAVTAGQILWRPGTARLVVHLSLAKRVTSACHPVVLTWGLSVTRWPRVTASNTPVRVYVAVRPLTILPHLGQHSSSHAGTTPLSTKPHNSALQVWRHHNVTMLSCCYALR